MIYSSLIICFYKKPVLQKLFAKQNIYRLNLNLMLNYNILNIFYVIIKANVKSKGLIPILSMQIQLFSF